jgi:hypothetical protein
LKGRVITDVSAVEQVVALEWEVVVVVVGMNAFKQTLP